MAFHYMNASLIYSSNNDHLDYFQYSAVTDNVLSMVCSDILLFLDLEMFPVFYLKFFCCTNNFAKSI